MIKKISIPLIISALIAISGCNTEAETPPNILWITAEDISPALGCYDDPYATTPNIDQLAANGIVYNNVYATAPICAPARSALITGIHATTMGTPHLRSEIPVPKDLKILPEFLREAGYFTTNNSKTDYNFDATGRWNENGSNAHWKNRNEEQPFFSVFNYGITHEGNTNKFTSREVDGLTEYHNPDDAKLPPYFPDTEEMRTIWAHAYDLITKFDMVVGDHVKELKDEGLLENTIIFVFSDHGFGLPRYKRWCYRSGIHVPLVVHVPDKYKHMFQDEKGSKSDQLISFADFAPTVMDLAGINKKENMHGIPFSGKSVTENQYLFAARSRADDVYDISRLVSDGRYVYVYNFMSYKPYIQDAVIFSNVKRSLKELNTLEAQGKLNEISMRMYTPKPTEELYDLKNDPYELENIINDPEYISKKEELNTVLFESLLDKNDIGFLHESEMMIRSAGSSPYEIGAIKEYYNKESIIEAARLSAIKNQKTETLMEFLSNEDSGVRFWGLNGILNRETPGDKLLKTAETLIDDSSPAVAILASEICIKHRISEQRAYDCLLQYLEDQRPWVVLNAAISVRRIGERASPVLNQIENVVQKYYGDKGAGYSSWSYPMFIGFALDQAIMNCN